MEDAKKKIEDFVELFQPYIEDQIIPWIGTDGIVGLSILRDYPDNIKFISATNKLGEKDSVALIKVGYFSVDNEQNANLHVSITKASRFLLKGNWDFNFSKDNKESPTRESLEISKRSKQPIDLVDNSRYQFNLNSKRIKDLEKHLEVTPNNIVNEIFNLHLKTLGYSATFFRLKMLVQRKIPDITSSLNEWIKLFLLNFFGRTIMKTDDISLGIFKTYSAGDLRALSDEKTKVLGSDFPITNQSARTFAVVVLFIFLAKYYLDYDFLGLVELSNIASNNLLFSATLIGSLVLFFDRIVPYLFLYIINGLIRFNLWLLKKKFKFSG